MTVAFSYQNTASLHFLPAKLRIGGLEERQVIKLLKEHIIDMYEHSPEECVHTLNINALQSKTIKFWSAWRGNEAVGCVALKYLSPYHCEIKSMRTSSQARGTGVGSQLLNHVIEYAKLNGVKRLSLETGTMDFFAPARKLYRKKGFEPCGPFGDYEVDPHSCFMTLIL
ncbi:GNAT family N-acetyltransferase [Pseudoalteromonas phenolica]|uniref:Histone acetyltransferase HPA2 n=1 Tax=Pseudoalteromonas phenolica TaxID=161398 RepID=A0A0S2K7D7_9GAMM|nr:GNAT family N-acetyltransferase [Pseudoalteromonas phenolica]ALO44121.1 Histone acetyltransferase HPA2 [Pseudoalteromonas phenolica]MBE0357106.1 putative acetyltransferase [Pseudoalteromonas phenolica O-BC30]TMO57915.1 N-acetyltransferase [Pseudoalteromonas phenolica]